MWCSYLVSSGMQESLDSPIDRRSDYYRRKAREEGKPLEVEIQPQRLLNVPNILTFSRLILVPVFVALWFNPHRLAPLTAAIVFILAAATDWLDGFLARKVCQLLVLAWCWGSGTVLPLGVFNEQHFSHPSTPLLHSCFSAKASIC
jgi:hypothetical protein